MPAIGVDLGGTKIEALLLDDEGRTLDRKRIATPRGDYDATLEAIVGLVTEVEQRHGVQASVGLGQPGSTGPDGLLRNANSVWLNSRRFQQDLQERLRRPVPCANDANCLALSEATDGAGAGAACVFAVIIGTGTGGGLAIDGRTLTGRHGIAGEWGHNPLPWPRADELPGPACYCGKHGCIETWCSGTGFADSYLRAYGERKTGPEIVAAAQAGDRRAMDTLEDYQDRLARALASVVNVVDPTVIVLGGGMSNVIQIYPGLGERMAAYVFFDRFETPIVPARHGDSSGVRGAAWLGRAGQGSAIGLG
ncbi:MAG: ROK family protein [Geminicoccaceae bacterium]